MPRDRSSVAEITRTFAKQNITGGGARGREREREGDTYTAHCVLSRRSETNCTHGPLVGEGQSDTV